MTGPAAAAPTGGVRASVAEALRDLWVRPPTQLASLDALRSAAIVLVMFAHWGLVEYPRAGGPATGLQHHPLVQYGWTGVDLFFVLSGYLIGRQLWRELESSGDLQMGRFLLRRGFRIWPLYYVMLAAFALWSPIVHPRWSDWTFLSNYFPAGVARSWSLSTEEQFYILIPLLILATRRWVPLRAYPWLLLGLEAVVLAVRYATIAAITARGQSLERSDYLLVYPIHTHIEGLLAGLVLANLATTNPGLLTRRSANGFFARGALVGAALAATGLLLRALNHKLFAHLTLGLIYAGVTFFVLGDRSWVTRALGARVFYPLSRLSYALYLNHFWAWPAANGFAVRAAQSLGLAPAGVFVASLVGASLVSLAASVVTFILVERPFLRLREQYVH